MSQPDVEEMRSRLLQHLQTITPASTDPRKRRYPIGLTEWDDAIDGALDRPTAPVCLTEFDNP